VVTGAFGGKSGTIFLPFAAKIWVNYFQLSPSIRPTFDSEAIGFVIIDDVVTPGEIQLYYRPSLLFQRYNSSLHFFLVDLLQLFLMSNQ